MKIILVVFIVLFAGCSNGNNFIPKPRAYPKVIYPKKDYMTSDGVQCPFSFDYPVYSSIVSEKRTGTSLPKNDCWFDLEFPMFQASIHCSYIPISEQKTLAKLINDAFEISDVINKRSNFMSQTPYKNKLGTGGMVFDFDGPSASPIHFFLTDSVDHFFKGSLYFDNSNQVDSLTPVIDFLKEDLYNMLNTFQWKY